jgi:DNA-binding XRE family transcriptional regulator
MTDTCRLRFDVVERRLHELGVTDTDTARGEFLGVTRQTVHRWRSDRTGVGLTTAIRIASAIGVQLEQLIDASAVPPGTPPPSPPPPQPPKPSGPPGRGEA